MHTNALDEALALPTDYSARIARNTQIFLQNSIGATDSIDPWGGSYLVETLTEQLIERARKHIEEIRDLGGMAQAIERGVPKLRIEEAATRRQARIESGKDTIVGVNKFQSGKVTEMELLEVDNTSVRKSQIKRLEEIRKSRDQVANRST